MNDGQATITTEAARQALSADARARVEEFIRRMGEAEQELRVKAVAHPVLTRDGRIGATIHVVPSE